MVSSPAAIRVREGSTGILQLETDSKTRQFVPNCDEDAARTLLLEFQELFDSSGSPLRSNYSAEGFNWYPSTVSFLYWYVFWPFVKYESLIEDWIEGRAEFTFEGSGSFQNLMEILNGGESKRSLKTRIHYLLMKWSNRAAVRQSSAKLLFFRFSREDFRTAEIRKGLEALGAKYIDVVPAPKISELLSSLFRSGKNYHFSQPPPHTRGNRFSKKYPLEHFAPLKRRLFAAAIQAVEKSITSFIVEYHDHSRALRHCTATIFYGLDDVNGYIFPILYACRKRGMRTIGHQHGAYVKRHAAYRMEGIQAKDFVWFDRVIVWGQYWREKMRRDSLAYAPDFFIVGSNKFSSLPSFAGPDRFPPRTVLVPYEFLANTTKVGQYIERLVDLGYRVVFKARPDEAIDAQLDAYSLSGNCRQQIKITAKLDADIMQEIDIVAGTMTTLIYEMLPYHKIVWVLETEFHHLLDLVEEGLGHLIRFNDLLPPEQMPPATLTRTFISRELLFGNDPLLETLRKHVLPL